MIVDQPERFAKWVFERYPKANDSTDFQAIGLVDGERTMAAFVVNQYDGTDAQISVVTEPGVLWARPKWMRALANYVFVQLGCARLSAHVQVSNFRSCQAAERIGFSIEGFKRPDTVMYGMLKQECRYL